MYIFPPIAAGGIQLPVSLIRNWIRKNATIQKGPKLKSFRVAKYYFVEERFREKFVAAHFLQLANSMESFLQIVTLNMHANSMPHYSSPSGLPIILTPR